MLNNTYIASSHNSESLSYWLFQVIENNISLDTFDFVFDFSSTEFFYLLKFIELFDENSKGYQWARENSQDFTKVLDVIQGINVDDSEKPIYRLHFKFDKAIFHKSVDLTNMRCCKLSFEDTIFHQDAKFAFVDVEEFVYKPYQLDVDVTFYHRERANMAEGKLRGEVKGGIRAFYFRHHLQGSGKTYFVGVNFQKAAYFQDVNLENVVFSYIDRASMSKCYFANSLLENTQFYKCEFDYNKNRMAIFSFSKQYLFILIPFCCLGLWFILYFLNIQPNQWYIFQIILLFSIILTLMSINLAYMFLMYGLQKISSGLRRTHNVFNIFEVFELLNHHICVADDDIKHKETEQQKENFQSLREVYRQLRINHEKHGDWQLAGEFYYSQRYCEVISQMYFFKGQLQHMLLNVHHVVNGFGERWLRALVWVCLTLGLFALFGGEPNRDYVSTKSTPEYLLVAHKPMSDKNAGDHNRTYYQEFDESNVTDKNISEQAHFMLYSKTTYLKKDDNTSSKVFAYDERFNYHYNEQYIPMLKNSFEVKLLHSLSKFVSPFTSSEKQWFQDRSGKAYFGGFGETMLLWLFFGGFVLAVKNKIKR
jgi:uncharacterized protein YjbI with pentapeptide repeats